MSGKIIAAIVVIAFAGLLPVAVAFSTSDVGAPCCCCGDACTCEACVCDELGCDCADGGECVCGCDCCALGCCQR